MSNDRRDNLGRFAAAGGAASAAGAGVALRAARRNNQQQAHWRDVSTERARTAGGLGRMTAKEHKLSWAHYQFADAAAANPDTAHRAQEYREVGDRFGAQARDFARRTRAVNGYAAESRTRAKQYGALARRNKVAAGVLGASALAGAAIAGHRTVHKGAPVTTHEMRRREINKFLRPETKAKVTSAVNRIHITPQQARTASALGQVGGSAGALTGAAIGATAGAFTHHAATGAGIGAAIGGSLGGGGGAALGLYSARPKKPRVGQPVTKKIAGGVVAKSNGKKRGGSVAGGIGGLSGYLAVNNVQRARKHKKDAVEWGERAASRRKESAESAKQASNYLKVARGNAGFAESSVLGNDPLQRHSHYLHQSRNWAGRAKAAGESAQGWGGKAKEAAEHAEVLRASSKAHLRGAALVAGVGLGVGAAAGSAINHWDESQHHRNHGEFTKFDDNRHRRDAAGRFVATAATAAGTAGAAVGAGFGFVGHHSEKVFNQRTAERVQEADRLRQLSRETKGEESINHLRRSIGVRVSAATMKTSADAAKGIRESGGRMAMVGTGVALGGLAANHYLKTKSEADAYRLSKLFDEAKHKRNHGKFAPVAVGTGASVAGTYGGLAGVQGAVARSERKSSVRHNLRALAADKAALNPGLTDEEQAATRAGVRSYRSSAEAGAKNAELLGRAARRNGKVAAAGAGLAALGLAAEARHKKQVAKSFLHPEEDTKRKAAQAGLAGASIADVVGAKSAFSETKNAVKPVTEGMKAIPKVRALASYAGKKSAFPIVAGGIAATALAEHELHNSAPKPPKEPTMSKSADEVFTKAREANMEKSWAGALSEGQKAVGMARGVGGFHAANLAHAVADPMNRAAVKGVAGFHAGNVAHAVGGLSTGAKVGGAAAGASFLAGAAALHHHLHSDVQKNISPVDAIFAKARGEVTKALEPETRKGMKVGGGIGAVGGTALGGPRLGVHAAAVDGAIGAGIGGMVGAHKANKRIKRGKAAPSPSMPN